MDGLVKFQEGVKQWRKLQATYKTQGKSVEFACFGDFNIKSEEEFDKLYAYVTSQGCLITRPGLTKLAFRIFSAQRMKTGERKGGEGDLVIVSLTNYFALETLLGGMRQTSNEPTPNDKHKYDHWDVQMTIARIQNAESAPATEQNPVEKTEIEEEVTVHTRATVSDEEEILSDEEEILLEPVAEAEDENEGDVDLAIDAGEDENEGDVDLAINAGEDENEGDVDLAINAGESEAEAEELQKQTESAEGGMSNTSCQVEEAAS